MIHLAATLADSSFIVSKSLAAMGDDSDSGNNSSPEMAMEDNSVQLLRDSGSVSTSSTTEVVKKGPGVAELLHFMGGYTYKHYFQVISEDFKNLRVHCTLCGHIKTLLSAKNTTFNFKKHFNAVDKNVKLVAK